MMMTNAVPKLATYDLLTFVSPEHRCLYALKTASEAGLVEKVWIVDFIEYERQQPDDMAHADQQAVLQYKENRARIHQWAEQHNAESQILHSALDIALPIATELGDDAPLSKPLVVDISCTPRGRLFSLLRYLASLQSRHRQRVILMYSLVKEQSSDEESFSYGMQDVRVIPGFEGRIRLKKDLLILVLGFEGNRAFSLYRRLMPNRTLLILGDSGDNDRDFYWDRARENNYPLISIPGTQIQRMSSRNPLRFARQLSGTLLSKVNPISDAFNVYFSCLGTKLQVVGAFLALRSYPYIQVVEAVPSHRRIASEGERETLFLDFGTTGLLDDLPMLKKSA